MKMSFFRSTTAFYISLALFAFASMLNTCQKAEAADAITTLWAETCYEVQDRFPEQVDCWEVPAPQFLLVATDTIKQDDGTVFKLKAGAYIGDGKILLSKRYRDRNPEYVFHETIVHEVVHYVLDYTGVYPLSSGTGAECFSEYHAWDIADEYVRSVQRRSRASRRQHSKWGHNYPQCSEFSVEDYRAGLTD